MGVNIERVCVIFIVLCARRSAETRSLGAVQEHKIAKRQLQPASLVWENTCPPPAFIDKIARKQCTDSCHSNDFCPGRQLCCENAYGCRNCMNPVLPPAVIDWIDNIHKEPAPPGKEIDNEIHIKEPHYEEVECLLDGKSYPLGVFYRGCKKCYCNIRGAISCDARPCKTGGKTVTYTDNERVPGYEGSGSSGETPTTTPTESLNEFRPISRGEGGQFLEVVAPEAKFMAFDPPRLEQSHGIDEAGESGGGESGDGKSGSGENSNDINVEHMRHSTAIKISSHMNEVDSYEKVEDIFLI